MISFCLLAKALFRVRQEPIYSKRLIATHPVVSPSTFKGTLEACICDSQGACRVRYLLPDVTSQPYGTTSFSYSVTTNDPNLGGIESSAGTVNIDIRPKPIAANKTDFSITGSPIQISVNPSHPTNLSIDYCSIVTAPAKGSISSGCSCVNNICTMEYLSSDVGIDTFDYLVSTQDPILGQIDSTVKTVTVDIRPRPMTIGGNLSTSMNVPLSISIKPLSISAPPAYSHAYNYLATSIQIINTISGVTDAPFCVGNNCTFNFTPDNNFTGTAEIHFKVRVFDSVANAEVYSAGFSKIFITVP